MEKKEYRVAYVALTDQLKKQLIYGCGESNCIGVFCKVSDVETVVDEVAAILAEYNEFFTCSCLYINHGCTMYEMLGEKKLAYKLSLHPNLSSALLPTFPPQESVRSIPRRVSFDYSRVVLEYLYNDLSHIQLYGSAPGTPLLSAPLENHQKESLLMELAGVIHLKKSKTTSIMLQGLFYHELNKIRISYDIGTTVRIVKLFNAVKESVKFEKKYFIRFLEAVQEMCTKGKVADLVCTDRCNRMAGGLSYNKPNECKFTEEEEFSVPEKRREFKPPYNREIEVCILCGGSLGECEYPHCDYLCYGSGRLCVNELIDLIKSLIIVIDNTSVINMREGTLLLAILKSLKTLYEFAVHTGTVHHSIFVNRRFSRLLNYKLEVKYHKEGHASILDYPFILDMTAKSDLVQIENTERMKTELQNAFFRSLFEGKTPPYLKFEIRRETIFEDSTELLKGLKEGMAWRQLKIKFLGEDGIDSGGIKKEFFQILSQKTLGKWDIFEEKNGFLWLKTMSSEEIIKRQDDYYTLGSILGLAAYNGAVLCFYFPQLFYKKMLGYATGIEDIKQIDPSLYQSLTNMRQMTNEEILALGLEIHRGTISLGVTKDNLEDFISEYRREILDTSLDPAFEFIKQGLWSICGDTFIRSLLPCELSILIGGLECTSFSEIEKYVVYNGYRKDSQLVKNFWDIYKNYDIATQKKFLRFVTGTDRAPSGGISRMAIVFMRNGIDTDRLPTSQTCFNTLLMPEYSSKKKLKEKLGLALNLTEGFFLL